MQDHADLQRLARSPQPAARRDGAGTGPIAIARVPSALAGIQRLAGNQAAAALASGTALQRVACSGGNCSCAGCAGGQQDEGGHDH